MNTTSTDIDTDEAAALLRTALVEMVGESDPANLKRMIIFIRNSSAPEDEKATIINAIDALLRTQNIKSKNKEGSKEFAAFLFSVFLFLVAFDFVFNWDNALYCAYVQATALLACFFFRTGETFRGVKPWISARN